MADVGSWLRGGELTMLGSGRVALTPDGGPGFAVQVSAESALVIRALTEYRDETEAVDVAEYLIGASRQNDKRPAKVEFLVPDVVVKSLKGLPEERGKLMAVWIPAQVLEDLRRVVVSPQEAAAGGGPLIVTP